MALSRVNASRVNRLVTYVIGVTQRIDAGNENQLYSYYEGITPFSCLVVIPKRSKRTSYSVLWYMSLRVKSTSFW